jgi:hypothetical protein
MVGMASGFWAQVAFGVYQYSFFAFYGKMQLFGLITLAIMLTGGIFSNLACALISEKWGKTNDRAKSYVATVMSIFSAIFFFLMF